MVESVLPDDEKVLADRLKHEAETSRPQFSAALHAKICEAVRPGEASPARPPARRRRRIAYACAAVCLAVAVVVAWQLAGPPAPQPDLGGTTPVAQTPELLGELYALSESTELASQVDPALPPQALADLDHDARMLTQLLIDQLPLNAMASNGKP